MHPKRHSEMVSVQQYLQNEFNYFQELSSIHLGQPTKRNGGVFLFQLLEDRIYNPTPLLKAYFTRKVYDYLKHEAYQRATDKIYSQIFPFVMEIEMTRQYHDNQILDRKAGVVTAKKINESLITKNLLESMLWQYIDEVLPSEIAVNVTKGIRKIQQIVSWGQLIEKQNNLYSNYKNNQFELPWGEALSSSIDYRAIEIVKKCILEIAPELKSRSIFLDWYLRKIYFTGAFFYVQVVHIVGSSIQNSEQCQNLSHFAGTYGMMMQIVNDIADLVISKFSLKLATKYQSDAMSDIKTQNITLPLLIHLENRADGLLREKLEANSDVFSALEEEMLLKELFNSGSIQKAITIGKTIARYVRTIIDTMPENPNSFLFKDLCNIADFNQPYKKLAELEQQLTIMS